LVSPEYAPGTIALNVTWIEIEFNAGQTRRSMCPSIFNRLRAIANWSEIETFSYPLAFNAPIRGVPIGIPGKILVLIKLESTRLPGRFGCILDNQVIQRGIITSAEGSIGVIYGERGYRYPHFCTGGTVPLLFRIKGEKFAVIMLSAELSFFTLCAVPKNRLTMGTLRSNQEMSN